MKQLFRTGLALTLLAPSLLFGVTNDGHEIIGRSFLTIRPLLQPASPELISLWRDKQAHAKDDGIDGNLQIIVFGGQTNNSDELAAYFSPTGNCKLRASDEDNRGVVGPFQLYAPFFSVSGTAGSDPGAQAAFFSSDISFAPKHSEVGVGFAYRQSFWHSDDESWGLFLKAVMPITHVKNEMGLVEKNIQNNDNAPVELAGESPRIFYASMAEAFVQPAWRYGKIATDCGKCSDELSETGVADIQLYFGYEWLQHHPYHVEGYIGMLIPTGTKVTSEFLFEPIVGRGKHFGLMWGSAFGCDLWDHCTEDRHLRFELAFNSLYLFSKEQLRSFDLKNRPWSRYIDVYENVAQATTVAGLPSPADVLTATPGINIFTRSAEVTPGLEFTITPSFVFEWCDFVAEAGYSYYARGADHIDLCSFPSGTIALRSVNGNGLTMPFQRIDAIVEDASIAPATPVSLADYSKSVININDIDVNSAATPSYYTSTIYAALGYSHTHGCYPIMAGLGGSYEFTNHTNAGLDRWTLWLKGSIAF